MGSKKLAFNFLPSLQWWRNYLKESKEMKQPSIGLEIFGLCFCVFFPLLTKFYFCKRKWFFRKFSELLVKELSNSRDNSYVKFGLLDKNFSLLVANQSWNKYFFFKKENKKFYSQDYKNRDEWVDSFQAIVPVLLPLKVYENFNCSNMP